MWITRVMTIVDIIWFTTALISYITSVILYVKTGYTNYNYMSSLADNWKLGLITNVTGSKNTTCEEGYLPFITDKWPGTVKGCNLLGNLYPNRMNCGKSSSSYVSSLSPEPYIIWKGVSLCSTKNNISYLNLSIAESSNSCPSGSRSCGIIDTLNNVLCIKDNVICPYNYMDIVPGNKPISLLFNYTSIDLNEDKLILSNSKKDGKMLIEFQLSEDLPCLDSNYKNYLFPPFIMEYYYGRDTCPKESNSDKQSTDYNFDYKDQYSYYNVYNENKIISLMNKTLPTSEYFNTLQKSGRKLKLFSRSYTGIKVNCLHKLKEMGATAELINELSTKQSKTEDSSSIVLYSVVFGSIYISIVCLLFLVNTCCGDLKSNQVNSRPACFIFPQLFQFPILIISCVICSRYNNIGDYYKILIEFECVDTYINEIISNSVSDTSKIIAISIIIIFSSIVNILVYFIYFFLFYKSKSMLKDTTKCNDVQMEKSEENIGNLNIEKKVEDSDNIEK